MICPTISRVQTEKIECSPGPCTHLYLWWNRDLFQVFKILLTYFLNSRSSRKHGFPWGKVWRFQVYETRATVGKGWSWTQQSWWSALIDSTNLNSECKWCETSIGGGDWTEEACLHLSPVSLRAPCLLSEPRISAVCKAMTPSSRWAARNTGARTGQLPEASYQGSLWCVSLPCQGWQSLTAVCSSRKPSKEENILKKETMLHISNKNRCYLQMPCLLQVSWMLFSALSRSSLGTLKPNEPTSRLCLFYPRWKETFFFNSFLGGSSSYPRHTPHQNMQDQVKVVRTPHDVCLLEMFPDDDGGDRSCERLCRHLLGICQPAGKGLSP